MSASKRITIARGHMETLFSGLIPVRAIGAWCDVLTRLVQLRLEITDDCKGYRKGEVCQFPQHSLVRQVPSRSCYIHVETIPIDWKDPTPLL